MRREVRVFSDSVLCVVNNNAFPNQTWATELSEAGDSSTFMDKCDITGRPVAHFQTTLRSKSRETFRQSWDPRNRWISDAETYSCLCSTTLNIRNQAMSKHVRNTQKKLLHMRGFVDLDKKECVAVRAQTNQPENGIASPGKRHRSLKKHIRYSIVLNRS